MKLLTYLAKWFLISASIGVLTGALIVGINEADSRYHLSLDRVPFLGTLELYLAPGIIVGLGMPPLATVLLDVCVVNFLLYGCLGVLIGIFLSVIRPLGATADERRPHRE